jgi:hypothetical protein
MESIGVLRSQKQESESPFPPPQHFVLDPGASASPSTTYDLPFTVISAKKSARFLSIALNWCTIGARLGRSVSFVLGHCVTDAFIFIHIAGSIFIFNISLGYPPVLRFEKHVVEPSNLTKV